MYSMQLLLGIDALHAYLPKNNTYRNKKYPGSLAQSTDLPTSQRFCKEIQKCSSASSVWNSIYMSDCMHQSWVHVTADGLYELNQCCSFAFKHHWIKRKIHKNNMALAIFRAEAY